MENIQNYENKIVRLPEILTPQSLFKFLELNSVPVESWEFNNLFKLFIELKSDDSRLIVEENELKRFVEVAVLDIYTEDGTQHLIEKFQEHYSSNNELVDTTIRNFPTSLSEIKKSNETFEEAVQRGVNEELGISSIDNLQEHDSFEVEKTKMDYPGLKSKYHFVRYSGIMPKDNFNADGYLNYEPNLGYSKVFLGWEPSSSN